MECCLELLDRGLLVALQDLGAAGLTSSSAEMAAGGGVGVEIAVDRVPLREADMEAFEIMISESQERMLAVVDPARTDEVMAICERWQTGAAHDRRGHRRRIGPGHARRRGWSPTCRSRRWSTNARSMTWSPSSRIGWLYGNRRRARSRRRAERRPGRAARISERGLEAMGVRAVRLDRPVADRAPAGGGGRGGAEAGGDRRGDRDGDRRQRAPRRLRPVSGDDRGGARVRPEPRLRRSAAAGADQLPQLRQPREAPRRLAARPLGAGAGRRVRGARGAGRGRERVALQRDRGRDRSTPPLSSAWSASFPTRLALRGSR